MMQKSIIMAATTSAAESASAAIDPKKPRQRSAAYPSYTIESCIVFTGKIDTAFSSVGFTPQESISKTLDQSGGAFLMQLSSCVQYGLLDKSSGNGYKPSALFKKINKPLPSEKVDDLKLECFSKPALYKKLIEAYRDKQVPAEAGLANILDRVHGIVGKASAVAARVFYKNLQSLKILAEGNVLKLDGYIPAEEQRQDDSDADDEAPGSSSTNITAATAGKPQVALPLPSIKEIPIVLKEKGTAKLILPVSADDEDLKRVIKVLQAYVE
jgi:hypothetical protein